FASQKDNDKDTNTGNKEEDPVDAFVTEQQAGRKVAERLMFPRMVATSISKTVTAFGWGFVILSIVLQNLGYALISDNHGGFQIGTLEQRHFQEEMHMGLKDPNR
ncbi:MAG: hypothetical protein SGILL_001688, partial [Bacillariaceae sp.]